MKQSKNGIGWSLRRRTLTIGVAVIVMGLTLAIPGSLFAQGGDDRESDNVTELTILSSQPEGSHLYEFTKLVLSEACRRNGITLDYRYVPTARAVKMVQTGQADGEGFRIYAWGEAHPFEVRVEESHYTVHNTAFALDPTIEVEDWEDLKAGNYRVGYQRGIKVIESNLVGLIDEDNLVPLESTDDELVLLAAGRFDVLVAGSERATLKFLQDDRFKDAGIHNVGRINSTDLYPYLHEKHADLAPRLAATIKEMKEEGLFEQYEAQLK